MSTITITISDAEDGGVNASASFDPQIDLESAEKYTAAEKLSLSILQYAFPPDNDDVTWTSRNAEKESDDGN